MIDLKHVSYSALTTYRNCPKSWWFRYAQDEVKPAMRLCENVGSLWHQWQEQYARHCMELEVSSDFSHGYHIAGTYPPEVEALAHEFISHYRYDWAKWRGRGSVEITKTRPIADDLPVFLARMDALSYDPLEGKLTITDFKTPYSYDYSDDPPKQLLYYAWVAQYTESEFAEEPLNYCELVRWIVPKSEAQTWMVDYPLTSPGYEIEALTREALTADEYPATPSTAACQYCEYHHACPSCQRREWVAPTSRDECETLLADADAHRAAASAMTDQARAWMRENGLGELTVNGQLHGDLLPQWFLKGETHLQPRDVQEFVQACQSQGVDPWQYVAGFDVKRLGREFGQKAAEDNPFGDHSDDEHKAIAATLTEEKPSARWGSRNAG